MDAVGVDRRLGWTLAVLCAAAAAAWGLWSGVSGWPDLATHLRDDAFYEFTWACNLVRGEGPAVSDGTTTSGVQVLWCLLLAWLAGGQPEAIADVAVLAGIGCHVAAAATFVVAARGRVGGWCIALLWLGNPLLLRECQNGQETALACLCVTLLWHARRAPELLFAVLALLAVLARSDLFAVVLLLSLVRHGRRMVRGLAVPTLTLGVMVAINVRLGGGPLPDSALPMAWLAHASFAAGDPTGVEWLRQQWWYLRPTLLGAPYELAQAAGVALAVFLVVRPWWPRALRVLPALVVVVAYALGVRDVLVPAVAALLIALLPAAAPRHVSLELLALLVGLGAIVALHWAVRWYPRDYYAAPLATAGAAALLLVHRLPLMVLLAGALQLHAVESIAPVPLQHQRAMDLAGRYLPELLAGTAGGDGPIGCFNSGIVAFRQLQRGAGERLRVLNLDGVVDHRAFAALREGRLGEWLDDQAVRLLVDNPVQFEVDPRLPHACGRWFGPDFDPARDLRELARFVALDDAGQPVSAGRPGTGDFRLYWRVGRGERPELAGTARQLPSAAADEDVIEWPARRGERLLVETAAGGREVLLQSDVDAVVVVALPGSRRGTGRLFVADGRDEAGRLLLELR